MAYSKTASPLLGWGHLRLEIHSREQFHSSKVLCSYNYRFIITTCELVLLEPEHFVRSAHAFVEAEADFEDQEKLGEAAMQFFYASKVLLRSLTIVLQASSMFLLASEIILFFNPGWG